MNLHPKFHPAVDSSSQNPKNELRNAIKQEKYQIKVGNVFGLMIIALVFVCFGLSGVASYVTNFCLNILEPGLSEYYYAQHTIYVVIGIGFGVFFFVLFSLFLVYKHLDALAMNNALIDENNEFQAELLKTEKENKQLLLVIAKSLRQGPEDKKPPEGPPPKNPPESPGHFVID